MGVREQMTRKPVMGGVAAGVLALVAVAVLVKAYWPERQADLSRAFYTTDDGATWFEDSALKVAPFDHEGKPAVVAHVYSYAGGSKQFCAYVAKFTPEGKERLERAVAEAVKNGKGADSVGLYHDPSFMKGNVLVKPARSGGEWVSYGDRKANEIFSVHAPDGSVVDEVFVQ